VPRQLAERFIGVASFFDGRVDVALLDRATNRESIDQIVIDDQ
jgi:hypothetical protein